MTLVAPRIINDVSYVLTFVTCLDENPHMVEFLSLLCRLWRKAQEIYICLGQHL